MKDDDRQLGKPIRLYVDTKANIEALSLAAGDEGCVAYATDTDEIGTYNGSAWVWGSLGSAGADISARAYHDADQEIPNNAWTAVALNSERWDTDGIHDNVTNNSRLTCQTAGKYQITAHGAFASHSTGDRYIAIYLNGTTFIGISLTRASGGDMTFMSVPTLYDLGVGDFVEMYVKQTSSAGLDLIVSGNYSPEFAMAKILG